MYRGQFLSLLLWSGAGGSTDEAGSVSAVPLRERSGHVVTAEMGLALSAGSLTVGTPGDHAARIFHIDLVFLCLWSLRSVSVASLSLLYVHGWLHVVLRCLHAWHLWVQVVTGGLCLLVKVLPIRRELSTLPRLVFMPLVVWFCRDFFRLLR